MSSAQPSPTHEDVGQPAYHPWEERGAPTSSPDVHRERAEQPHAREGAEHNG
jgi:hypothetical protein